MKNRLYVFFLCLNLSGYPLIAGLSQSINVLNTPLSLTLRIFIIVISVFFILYSVFFVRVESNKILIYFLIIFWVGYVLRLFHATLVASDPLFFEPAYYWMWAIGGCMLPMFAAASMDKSLVDWSRAFRWVYRTSLLAGALAFMLASQTVNSQTEGVVETGRAQLAALNPISLGHLGTTVLLLSFWSLTHARRTMSFQKLAAVVGLALGGYLLVISNSRGPIFAAVFGLVFLVLAFRGRRKLFMVFALLGTSMCFIFVAKYLEEVHNFTTYSRLFGQEFFQEVNVVDRFDRFSSAFSDFIRSPVIGFGLEPSSGTAYPHNVFIEAFLNVGFLLGGVLVFSVGALLVKSISLCRSGSEAGWLSLLFVQHVSASMFSGALYAATYFWFVIGLMISVQIQRQNVANRGSNFTAAKEFELRSRLRISRNSAPQVARQR
jgi:O-Antigen ligase